MTDEFQIEVQKNARILKQYTFSYKTPVVIGRDPSSDLHLDAKEVSRKHCILSADNTGFSIEDFSLNGVKTDFNEPLGQGHWPFETRIKIGPYILEIKNALALNNNLDDLEKPDLFKIRKQALAVLVDQVEINTNDIMQADIRPHVEGILDRILFDYGITQRETRATIRDELADEAIGLGPLERLLKDDDITEIMVIAPDKVYVEKKGVLTKTDLIFSGEDSVRTIIERIITPLGRRIDEASPMVDARLKDGSRVNAIIPPLAIKGSTITIRKFFSNRLSMDDLISFKSISREMANFLKDAILARQNIVISGGTGSGKTTLLNVLSAYIPEDERIITIEDAAELSLNQPHVVTLETKPANAEGKGEISIRDLVKNSLRMRPDRIVVGECRGGEALDMLQAMNTGHDGSLTTTHANSPKEATLRLETLCLMAGIDLPLKAIRQQIAGAVDIIVQQQRFKDGSRRVSAISELIGINHKGEIEMQDIFRFVETNENGKEEYISTGWIPKFQIDKSTSDKKEA
jgi:pilus assembly protein CpaF